MSNAKLVYNGLTCSYQYFIDLGGASGGSGVVTVKIVATIADRDAIVNPKGVVWVMDATADPTVSSGSALYGWNKDTQSWIKIAEEESIDVVIEHNWDSIVGKPTSSVAEIDEAVTKKHTHVNGVLVDSLSVDSVTGGLQVFGNRLTVGPDKIPVLDKMLENAGNLTSLVEIAHVLIVDEKYAALEDGETISCDGVKYVKAINAFDSVADAVTIAEEGDVILVNDGVYTQIVDIFGKDNIKIRGNGHSVVINTVLVNTSSGCVFENLILDGASTEGSLSGIEFDHVFVTGNVQFRNDVSNVILTNCKFSGGITFGANVDGLNVSDSILEGSQVCFVAGNISNSTITRSNIGNANSEIAILFGEGATVSSLLVVNNTIGVRGSVFYIENGVTVPQDAITFTGNVVTLLSSGVVVANNAPDTSVVNYVIKENIISTEVTKLLEAEMDVVKTQQIADGRAIDDNANAVSYVNEELIALKTMVSGKLDKVVSDKANTFIIANNDGTVKASDYKLGATNLSATPTNMVAATELAVKNEVDALNAAISLKAASSDVYTKQEVDKKLVTIYKFKGSVQTYEDLASVANPVNGDVYNILTGTYATQNYAYDAESQVWDSLGISVDLSLYMQVSAFETEKDGITEAYILADIANKTATKNEVYTELGVVINSNGVRFSQDKFPGMESVTDHEFQAGDFVYLNSNKYIPSKLLPDLEIQLDGIFMGTNYPNDAHTNQTLGNIVLHTDVGGIAINAANGIVYIPTTEYSNPMQLVAYMKTLSASELQQFISDHLVITPEGKIADRALPEISAANAIENIKIGSTALTVTDKSVTLPEASTTTAGLLSAADKVRLDGLSSGGDENVIISVKMGADVLTPVEKVVTIPVASALTNGVITKEQFSKIDGIETGAQVNIIDTVKIGDTILTVTNKSIVLPEATTTLSGLLSASDKTKLNGLSNYDDTALAARVTELEAQIVTVSETIDQLAGSVTAVTNEMISIEIPATLVENAGCIVETSSVSDFSTVQSANTTENEIFFSAASGVNVFTKIPSTGIVPSGHAGGVLKFTALDATHTFIRYKFFDTVNDPTGASVEWTSGIMSL